MKGKWIVVAALFHFLEAMLLALMIVNAKVELPVPEIIRELFLSDVMTLILCIFVIFVVLFVIGIVLIGAEVKTPSSRDMALELMETQCKMRFIQIPLYVLLFLIAVFFLIISFFMAGITFAITIINIFAIALTGLYSIPVYVSLNKNGLISKGEATLYGILSFFFCVDVIVNVICCEKAKGRLAVDDIFSE